MCVCVCVCVNWVCTRSYTHALAHVCLCVHGDQRAHYKNQLKPHLTFIIGLQGLQGGRERERKGERESEGEREREREDRESGREREREIE